MSPLGKNRLQRFVRGRPGLVQGSQLFIAGRSGALDAMFPPKQFETWPLGRQSLRTRLVLEKKATQWQAGSSLMQPGPFVIWREIKHRVCLDIVF